MKPSTQLNLIAITIVLGLIFTHIQADDTNSRFIISAGGSVIRREKQPREIRGLTHLNIPRGFGKRGNEDPIERLQSNSDSFSIDWFANVMQNNLPLAKTVLHKFVDANGDGVLSTDELLRTD